jgi:DNA-binding transcriptional ArsR family regulator
MGFSETLSVLSDPIRRNILILLRDGKLSAGEIGRHFEVTGAAISYHLNKLKKADLIRETKYKNFIYYELNASIFEEVILWFGQFQQANLDKKEKEDEKDEK